MSEERHDLQRRREFNDVVEQHRPDLFRYAYWLARDRHVAEDVVQEALVRAWNAWGDLQDKEATRPWLVTIVRREHARYHARQRQDLVAWEDHEPELSVRDEDPLVLEMRRAILRLDGDYREPLVLQVIMGCSTKEIAGLMSLTQGAVLTRLHRARGQLKEMLGVEDAGEDES